MCLSGLDLSLELRVSSIDRIAGVLTSGQGMLKDEQVKWVGVYNAGPGCFCVRVERAE